MLNRNIKFPIVMKNGVQVRTIEELKESFEMETIVEYYFDGRLKTWLEQRFYKAEAELLEKLATEDQSEISEKLCQIFGVAISAPFDIQAFKSKRDKLSIINQYTDDPIISSQLHFIAMSQGELDQMIQDTADDASRTIYLLGESFEVSETAERIHYVGINQPSLTLIGTHMFDAKNKNIHFENVLLTAHAQIKLNPSSISDFEIDESKIRQGAALRNYAKTIKINKDSYKNAGGLFTRSSPSPRKIHIYGHTLCVEIGRYLAFYDIRNNRMINKIETYEYEQYVTTIKHLNSVYCLDIDNVSVSGRGWVDLYKVFKVDLNDPTKRETIYASFDKVESYNIMGVAEDILKMFAVRSNVNDSDNFQMASSRIEMTNKRLIPGEKIELNYVGSRSFFNGVSSYCYEGELYYFLPRERKLHRSTTKGPLLSFSGSIGKFVIGHNKLFALSSFSKDAMFRDGVSRDSLVAIGNIAVFDLNTGEQLGNIKAHEKDITLMKIANDVLLTCSGFSEIKLWDIHTLELIQTIKLKNDSAWNISYFDIDLCEDKLAVMCEDTVYIYE